MFGIVANFMSFSAKEILDTLDKLSVTCDFFILPPSALMQYENIFHRSQIYSKKTI